MREGFDGLAPRRLSGVIRIVSTVIESVGNGDVIGMTESADTVSAGVCAETLPETHAPQSSAMMNM